MGETDHEPLPPNPSVLERDEQPSITLHIRILVHAGNLITQHMESHRVAQLRAQLFPQDLVAVRVHVDRGRQPARHSGHARAALGVGEQVRS